MADGSQLRDLIDAELIALYKRGCARGSLVTLGKRIGVCPKVLARRAYTMKIVSKRHKTWSDAEDDVIENHAGATARAIRRNLRVAGFDRTIKAVQLRRKQLGLDPRDARLADGVFDAEQVATALAVSHTTIVRWMGSGKLPAKRDGNWYRISSRDVRAMLARDPACITIRHVPQELFLAVLLGDQV